MDIDTTPPSTSSFASAASHHAPSFPLKQYLFENIHNILTALCDDFNTPRAVRNFIELGQTFPDDLLLRQTMLTQFVTSAIYLTSERYDRLDLFTEFVNVACQSRFWVIDELLLAFPATQRKIGFGGVDKRTFHMFLNRVEMLEDSHQSRGVGSADLLEMFQDGRSQLDYSPSEPLSAVGLGVRFYYVDQSEKRGTVVGYEKMVNLHRIRWDNGSCSCVNLSQKRHAVLEHRDDQF